MSVNGSQRANKNECHLLSALLSPPGNPFETNHARVRIVFVCSGLFCRMFLMDKFDVQPDPWDNRIIVSCSSSARWLVICVVDTPTCRLSAIWPVTWSPRMISPAWRSAGRLSCCCAPPPMVKTVIFYFHVLRDLDRPLRRSYLEPNFVFLAHFYEAFVYSCTAVF